MSNKKNLSFGTSYPSFSEIPAGRNPANYVLIDYDTTGNYLRSVIYK